MAKGTLQWTKSEKDALRKKIAKKRAKGKVIRTEPLRIKSKMQQNKDILDRKRGKKIKKTIT